MGEYMISGKVVFDKPSKPFKNATVYVKLEDTSKQDVPSTVVAEQVIKNVGISKRDLSIGEYPFLKFVLRTKTFDEKSTYIVTVLVDVDGDGRPSLGDYVTTENKFVKPFYNPADLEVHVHEV